MLLRIEKWLEDNFERFFGPRESVQPIEIARRMVRTMEEQQRISVQRTYVPNVFDVFICKEDYAELESLLVTLTQDLADHMRAAAQRQGYAFSGPIEVRFAVEEGLKRGETRIDAQFVESEEEPIAPVPDTTGGREDNVEDAAVEEQHTGRYKARISDSTPVSTMESTQMYKAGKHKLLVMVRIEGGPDTGTEFNVNAPATIGRRQGCDIQLHDQKVSRMHARIERTNEGFVIIDTDSMNGIRLNGRVINHAPLHPGDVIEMGSTRLVLHALGGE
jgi:hypothetical protein